MKKPSYFTFHLTVNVEFCRIFSASCECIRLETNSASQTHRNVHKNESHFSCHERKNICKSFLTIIEHSEPVRQKNSFPLFFPYFFDPSICCASRMPLVSKGPDWSVGPVQTSSRNQWAETIPVEIRCIINQRGLAPVDNPPEWTRLLGEEAKSVLWGPHQP